MIDAFELFKLVVFGGLFILLIAMIKQTYFPREMVRRRPEGEPDQLERVYLQYRKYYRELRAEEESRNTPPAD